MYVLNETIRKKGYTYNIVFSTRLNLERLVNGERVVKSQWLKDVAAKELRV